MDKASTSSLFLLALDFQMVWCHYNSELKVSAAKPCLFEHNCSLALSAYFFGFYMFGKFLNEVSTNKIDFFIFVEGVYTLPCSIWSSLSPVFLCPVGYSFRTSAFRIPWKNGQIRNLSAIDSHVEVWVKSISCYYTSLHLKCFLSVLCGRREGRLKQKEKSLMFKTKTWSYHTEVWTFPVYGKSLGPYCQCWKPSDKPASTPEYLQEEVGSTAAPLPAPLLVMNFFPKVPIVSQSPSNLQNYSFLLSAFHLICFWDKNHLSNTNT